MSEVSEVSDYEVPEVSDVSNSDEEFLAKPSYQKIVFSNIKQNTIFFDSIYRYLSEQLYYLEVQQLDCSDPNIVGVDCYMRAQGAPDNLTYEINSIHFLGKNKCAVNKQLADMNIIFKYKLPSVSKPSDFPKNTDFIVSYTITTRSTPFEGDSVKKSHADKYKEIVFHPENKLSLKYFDSFISAIMKMAREKGKKYLTNATELAVYINIDAYWEELFKRPTRSIESIYMPHEDKQVVIDDLAWFTSKETQMRYETLGRNYKRVILFEGVPGSGKSSLALAVASHFGYDLAILSFTDEVTDGRFMRLMRQLPEKSILLLEDIDCLFNERKNNDNSKNYVTFSGILNALDGIATPHEFICIITTNYKGLLDDALLRPGRIDKIIKFDYATREQIQEIYKVYMGDNYNEDDYKAFYRAYKDLNVKCVVSLIQEYLFKYLDSPVDALANIEEIKDLKTNSTKESANVYS